MGRNMWQSKVTTNSKVTRRGVDHPYGHFGNSALFSSKRHKEIPQGKMFNPNLLKKSHMT